MAWIKSSLLFTITDEQLAYMCEVMGILSSKTISVDLFTPASLSFRTLLNLSATIEDRLIIFTQTFFFFFSLFPHFLHSFLTLRHPPPPNPSCGLALKNQGYHLSCHAHNNLNNRWMVNQWARTDLAADLDRSRLFARAITSSILRGRGSEMEAPVCVPNGKVDCSVIAVPLWRQGRL